MRDTLQTLKEYRLAQYVMGTLVEITVCCAPHEADEDAMRHHLSSGMDEFERLEQSFSRFDFDSELSRVNRLAARYPVKVSEEFFTVLAEGLEYMRQAAGCFSLQLAPLANLWEDCAARNRLPTEDEIERRRRLAERSLIKLNERNQTVRFLASGVELDLGGLVKGYAADRALERLRRAGLRRAIVNAGTSSITAFDLTAPENGPRFAIRDPRDERRIVGLIDLAGRALATSGTSERRFQIADRWFSHLIDPRNGWPLEGCLSATAVCDTAMRAEVVAKLLLFLDLEQALEICDRRGWRAEALTLRADQDGNSLQVIQTDQLKFLPPPAIPQDRTDKRRR
ncbi:MAG TPA: FAD:protein FMN transferase [Blastocatellia bacterium]|nr:FAD:protein FMN transferase [Blastocatellia bacterium]